jgi:hypothetical protein
VAAANLLYLSKWNPSPFLDLTPLGFALAFVALGSALLRYRPGPRRWGPGTVEDSEECSSSTSQPRGGPEPGRGRRPARVEDLGAPSRRRPVAAQENRAGDPPRCPRPRRSRVPTGRSRPCMARRAPWREAFVLQDTTEAAAGRTARNAQAELRVNEELWHSPTPP